MRKIVICICFMLIFTALVFADSVSMQINSMGGTFRLLQNRVYVGPSQLTIRGGSKTALWSDDYAASNPQIKKWWNANTTLLSSGNLAKTKWKNGTKYREAGWLLENRDELMSNKQYTQAQFHFALWNIFNPRATPDKVQGSDVQSLVNLAIANYRSFCGDLLIYTPTNRSKEFITLINPAPRILTIDPPVGTPPTNSVPEPSTLILLGSGLIGLASFARKRIHKDS